MLCLLIFIPGCASVGNESLKRETEFSVGQKIVAGKTTKNEIRLMFNSPISVSFNGGFEVWKYELSKMSIDAISLVPIVGLFVNSYSGTKKELNILFDENGIVKKYAMSESPVKVKSGLLP
ncbi:MAG: hypothetical protein RL637_1759 [Pseudomonadota bacterium]